MGNEAQAVEAKGGSKAAAEKEKKEEKKAPSVELWSAKNIYEHTNEGWLSGRPEVLKIIDKLAGFYHLDKNKNLYAIKLLIAKEMLDVLQNWFFQTEDEVEKKKGTKDSNQRTKKIRFIKDHLVEVIGALEKVAPPTKMTMEGVYANLDSQETIVHADVKKLRAKCQPGKADTIFANLGKAIDAVIPEDGESGSVELEVDFPLGGIFEIGLRFSLEAERDKFVTVHSELGVIAGVKIPLIEVQAEIGGYTEVKAKTSADAMKLLSYGLFRRFRESKYLPEGASNYLWGGGTDKSGLAEDFGSTVESTILAGGGDDVYVENGMYAGLKAEVGGDLLGAGASVKMHSGKKWDEKSVKEGKEKAGSQLGERLAKGKRDAKLSTDVSNYTVSLSLSVAKIKGEVEYTASDMKDGKGNYAHDVSLSVEGEVPFDPSGFGNLGTAIYDSLKLFKTEKDEHAKKNRSKVQTAAALKGAGDSVKGAVGSDQNPLKGIKESDGSPATATIKGSISISGDDTMESPKEWSGELKIEQQKFSFDHEFGVGKVEISKYIRLARVNYDGDGKWGGDLDIVPNVAKDAASAANSAKNAVKTHLGEGKKKKK